MSILVIAENSNEQLKDATSNALTAASILATKLGADIHLLVAGHQCAAVAEQASQIPNLQSVFVADNESLAHRLPENLAPLLVGLVKEQGVTHLIAPATSEGKNVLPRVAALLDVAQLSDVSDVIDEETFVRPIYAGNALATVKSSDAIKVITVRTASFDESEMTGAEACEIVKVSVTSDAGLSRFVGETVSKSERPELTSARIIISGGRGVGSSENFSLIEAVADKLGAAVGASRAAVDAGYVPNDMQVGQTGKIVAPDLYIAVGISGAIQHLAGMKESKVIVAINKDAEAPIFNVADYGLVADLFEVLPELEAALS